MKDARGHGSSGGGAAHQTGVHGAVPRVMEAFKRFAKSDSGSGHFPFVENLGHDITHDPNTLLHYSHFLGFLAAVAVVDVIVCSVMGWPFA